MIGRRQLRIQETSLRVAMLERRSKCITEMREIHAEWFRDSRLSQETWSRFREVFWESELIFSKRLSKEIDETLGALFWMERWYQRAQYYQKAGNVDQAAKKVQQSFEEDDKVMRLMPTLLDKLKDQTRVADWS